MASLFENTSVVGMFAWLSLWTTVLLTATIATIYFALPVAYETAILASGLTPIFALAGYFAAGFVLSMLVLAGIYLTQRRHPLVENEREYKQKTAMKCIASLLLGGATAFVSLGIAHAMLSALLPTVWIITLSTFIGLVVYSAITLLTEYLLFPPLLRFTALRPSVAGLLSSLTADLEPPALTATIQKVKRDLESNTVTTSIPHSIALRILDVLIKKNAAGPGNITQVLTGLIDVYTAYHMLCDIYRNTKDKSADRLRQIARLCAVPPDIINDIDDSTLSDMSVLKEKILQRSMAGIQYERNQARSHLKQDIFAFLIEDILPLIDTHMDLPSFEQHLHKMEEKWYQEHDGHKDLLTLLFCHQARMRAKAKIQNPDQWDYKLHFDDLSIIVQLAKEDSQNAILPLTGTQIQYVERQEEKTPLLVEPRDGKLTDDPEFTHNSTTSAPDKP